jgi:hypothetical protein
MLLAMCFHSRRELWVLFERGAVTASINMFSFKGQTSYHILAPSTFMGSENMPLLPSFLPSFHVVRAAVSTVVRLLFKHNVESCSSSFTPNKETVQYQRHNKWSDN